MTIDVKDLPVNEIRESWNNAPFDELRGVITNTLDRVNIWDRVPAFEAVLKDQTDIFRARAQHAYGYLTDAATSYNHVIKKEPSNLKAHQRLIEVLECLSHVPKDIDAHCRHCLETKEAEKGNSPWCPEDGIEECPYAKDGLSDAVQKFKDLITRLKAKVAELEGK